MTKPKLDEHGLPVMPVVPDEIRKDVEEIYTMNVKDDPYYGRYFLRFDRQFTYDKGVTDTLAVAIVNGSIRLMIGVPFYQECTMKGKKAFIKHEGLHIINEHIIRAMRKNVKPNERVRANVAMDIAINQYIPEIYDETGLLKNGKKFEACTPERYNLPKGKTWDWYFEALKEEVPDQPEFKMGGSGDGEGEPQDGDGQGQPNDGQGQGKPKGVKGDMTDHSWKHYGIEMNEEVLKEIIRQTAKETAREVQRNRGTVPSEIQTLLDMWIKESQVNWKDLLKNFIQSAFSCEHEETFARESRRYPDMYPGRKRSMIPEFTVAVDSSGSVGDKELEELFTEVEKICKDWNADLTLIQFDAEVFAVKPYRRGDYKKLKFQRGGTDFQPVLDYCSKKKITDVVILTDGGAPNPETKGVKILWALLPKTERPTGSTMPFFNLPEPKEA